MRAAPIDPRDQTLQIDDPTYGVYFWADVLSSPRDGFNMLSVDACSQEIAKGMII